MRGDGRCPRVTVSGSFRRSLGEIEDAVTLLGEAGADVLSPENPRAVGELDGFVFVASDLSRVISLLQQRHFAAIRSSDFLWVVAPEGRIGLSVGMEIGHALAWKVPVYCSHLPEDLTVRALVGVASSPLAPLAAQLSDDIGPVRSVLLDPADAIDEGHRLLTGIGTRLSARSASSVPAARDPVVNQSACNLSRMLDGLVEPGILFRSSSSQ
jgi:hypothetical protein